MTICTIFHYFSVRTGRSARAQRASRPPLQLTFGRKICRYGSSRSPPVEYQRQETRPWRASLKCRDSNPGAPTGQSVSNAYGIGSERRRRGAVDGWLGPPCWYLCISESDPMVLV